MLSDSIRMASISLERGLENDTAVKDHDLVEKITEMYMCILKIMFYYLKLSMQ